VFVVPQSLCGAVLSGNSYINVHTTAFPGGEIGSCPPPLNVQVHQRHFSLLQQELSSCCCIVGCRGNSWSNRTSWIRWHGLSVKLPANSTRKLSSDWYRQRCHHGFFDRGRVTGSGWRRWADCSSSPHGRYYSECRVVRCEFYTRNAAVVARNRADADPHDCLIVLCTQVLELTAASCVRFPAVASLTLDAR
jgi:hypothetical protein